METIYKVDLNKTKGEGEFTCPVCGSVISPDDFDEKSYKIIEIRTLDNEIDEILLKCNKCHNTISVVGFDKFNPEKKTKKSRKLKGSTDKQILQLLGNGSNLTINEIAKEIQKNQKTVYKALKKLFQEGKIENNAKTRTYKVVD